MKLNLSVRKLTGVFVATLTFSTWTVVTASPFELLYQLNSPLLNYGQQVELSGDSLLVGSEGGAFLYDAKTGALLRTYPDEIVGLNPPDSFGLSGDNAVFFAEVGHQTRVVKSYNTDTNDPPTQMVPLDSNSENLFGIAPDTNGVTIAVGAPFDNNLAGAVYLFDRDTGDQLAKLESPVPLLAGTFGAELSIGNDWLAAVDDRFFSLSGIVRVYDLATLQEQTVLETPEPDDSFGFAIDVHEDLVITGAPRTNQQSGRAYVHSAVTGELISVLDPNDPSPFSDFGEAVSIHGDLAIVGATETNENLGAAYIFDVQTGEQLARLVPSDSPQLSEFGESVAINERFAVVGHPSIAGATYVYSVPEPCIPLLAMVLSLLAFRAGMTR